MSRIYRNSTSKDGATKHYSITLETSKGGEIELEVTKDVFEALNDLQRDIWRMQRSDDRHIRHMEMLSENELPDSFLTKSAEDIFVERSEVEDFKAKLRRLPIRQLKRLLLHYMLGYSVKQIAELENCSDRAVKYSLSLARKNLRKIFNADLPF